MMSTQKTKPTKSTTYGHECETHKRSACKRVQTPNSVSSRRGHIYKTLAISFGIIQIKFKDRNLALERVVVKAADLGL